MPTLGVNIDHVATVRQARRTTEPDPVWAAAMAELGGADQITVHLREDRRHIQDRDVRVLRDTVNVRLNMECACVPEMLDISCRLVPHQVCLVPEKREEVTTEGGLDVSANRSRIEDAIKQLHDAGIVVSLFIDPSEDQIRLARSRGDLVGVCVESRRANNLVLDLLPALQLHRPGLNHAALQDRVLLGFDAC